jgi:hypothetical protein
MSSHFGNYNPDGLLNLQRAIVRVKIHCIEKFFISLEKFLECTLHVPKLLDRFKMNLKYKTMKKLRARGTFPNFQHFGGVEGRVGALGWD